MTALPQSVVLEDPRELTSLCGRDLVLTEWITVSQSMIDAFATATGDDQWIHVDRDRAAASVFGTTIAHGFLTLSLLPRFLTAVRVPRTHTRINTGLEYARFLAPLPSDTRVRARLRLDSATVQPDTIIAVWDITIERERSPMPVCVARWLMRYLMDGSSPSGAIRSARSPA